MSKLLDAEDEEVTSARTLERPKGRRRTAGERLEYVSLEEVKKRVIQVAGMPRPAAEAITAALFLCGRRPPQLLKHLRAFRKAAIPFAQWIAENGGPAVASHILEIDCMLDEKVELVPASVLARAAAAFRPDAQDSAKASVPAEPSTGDDGADLQIIEDSTVWWKLVTDGVHCRFVVPKRGDTGSRFGGARTLRRGVDSFMRIAKLILVEHGCQSGLPSERRLDHSRARVKKGRSAVLVAGRVLKLLVPAGSRKRARDSLQRQSRKRKTLQQPRTESLAPILGHVYARFRNERIWVPRKGTSA